MKHMIVVFETSSMQSRSCPGPWDWQWSSLAEGMEGPGEKQSPLLQVGNSLYDLIMFV